MDIDIDRELAQELGLADEPQSREEPLRMDMDVDDELLSLVEDRPSTRPTEAPRAHHRPPKSKMSAPMKISSPVVGLSVPHSSSHHLFPSRSTSATVNSERESMPPPASTPGEGSRDRARTPKVDDRSQSSFHYVTKQQPKLLAQPKPPRPKATAVPIKAKSKLSKEPASLLGTKGKKGPPIVPPPATAKASSSTARSRSTSVMPGPGPAALDATRGDKDKPKAAEEEEEEESDSEGKLYCICKTKYDDEKVMIACDRRFSFFQRSIDTHSCTEEPQLDLRTTYKRRCLYGLKQRNPNSPDACHKPARGALSKYCSDECGIKYMQMRITVWTDNGGDKDRLWESVKNAERREGVVISAQLANGQLDGSANGKASKPSSVPGIVKPSKTKVTRELERLHAQLNGVVQKREEMRKEMDAVVWREKVTDLAIRRADAVEELVEFGVGVLESYDVGEAPRATDAMQLDGPVEEPVWWCSGKKKCDRHAGWQKLRSAEVQFEKEMKEQALQKLTTREREIRKRVEDISEPHARLPAATANPPSSPTRPLLEPKPVANGVSRSRPNGDSKKGKKKKNEIL
ncbi:hypothetical protein OF83DRAFT_1161093 [Amylostereum chailletii]|nr:hypothetical protein OF83DRAFT_1161093 [Amylostereum chailletii]